MVASYCQLLKRRYAATLDEKSNEFINFAVDGAQRMQALIDELLAYSRVGRGGQKIDRVNCNDVINRVRANLHKTLVDAGATIETGDLPTVMGYTSLVERLFANIISNAVKFRREEPPVVRVAATREGNAWRFSISDNGIGIDPAYADRVFVIFQRLHARHEYPGTGMGLAICKKIVEHHGGKIWLESVPGRGSTFHFTLPAEGGET
jgi:light-regulated signal transduction histidine kinase (bacteriophytochrome)